MNLFTWLFGRRSHQETEPALRIKPIQFGNRFSGTDEAVGNRTRQRREASDAMRARAARVDSGDKVGTILKMVKK